MRMRRVLSAVLALVPLSALATVVIAQSFEEMTRVAPLVVRGRVHQSQAARDPSERGIWTYTEVQVSEVLKGKAGSAILVKQPGGIVGRLGQRVDGAARFTPGEDVVLFLEPATDEKGLWIVLGLAAGKVTLEDQRGHLMAVRRTEGLAFAAPGPGGKTVTRTDDSERLGSADAFLKRIRAAAGAAR